MALSSFSDRASKFQLKIKTRSGAEVNIQIRDGQDEARGLRSGLGVSVQTTGPLTDDERKSIAKLAEGFEAALQGIGANNPQINIAGLVNFDSAQLSSVNFSYKPRGNMITERSSSFDFYADDRKVRVALKSPPGLPAGNFSIESDRSQPGLQGNPAQRQASVQRYLAQFETAVLKGKGSKDLLQQFKDSFAQINSEAPPSAVSRPPAIGTAPLPDSVSALLTGLGDFQASINGDFNNSSSGNYATQAGNFDYRADQKTELRQGNAPGNGSITQTKNEKLAVRIISSNGDNRLDTSTGNYNVRLIEESSQTKLLLDYVRGNLTQAKQVREQDESEKFTMYENFKVVEQSDKPRATTSVTDLLEKLNPA